MTTADDDARANRTYWDGYSDRYQAVHGELLDRPLAWGTWSVPEADIGALGELEALAGRDVLELGCGAAQWSLHLRRIGVRPVGLDASARQLDHARSLQQQRRATFPLVQSVATAIPFAAGSFDLVLSDHGAMSYADPADSLPEVARVLRPGGRLVFNAFTPFTATCWNDATGRPDQALHHDYFGPARWDDVGGFVSFEVGYGDWIRALRRHGFIIEDLHELRPGPTATSSHHTAADRTWARRWPAEHIWCARFAP
jgi:SAM-dependent methyltransferase